MSKNIFKSDDEIQRYGKSTILDFVMENARMWTTLINEVTDLEDLQSTFNKVGFGWTKGERIVAVTSDTQFSDFDQVLAALGLGVKNNAKTEKRIARAFSYRDVVVKVHTTDVNFVMVDDDEFTHADSDAYGADDREKLLDGIASISEEFAIKLCRMAGVDTKRLRKAEALSFTAVTPNGEIKALAYVTKQMMIDGADMIFSSPNVKDQLFTVDGSMYILFDFHNAFGAPTTNAQLEANFGRGLFTVREMADDLAAKLTEAAMALKSGKIFPEWEDMVLNERLFKGVKANQDFAVLPLMAKDFVMRGGDYRWMPKLVGQLAMAEANKWTDIKRGWYKFPMKDSVLIPVITESAAVLIGHEILCDRGEIRFIDDGKVAVVNDEDFMEFVSTNAGGSDLDDHYLIMLRVNAQDEKVAMVIRIPNGLGEFSIFKINPVDVLPVADPTWRKIPGGLGTDLATGLSTGARRYTGVGEMTPVQYPEKYNKATVIEKIVELAQVNAQVGEVINAMILAAAYTPELLAEMPCSVEEAIDTFTQGGATQARLNLQKWAKKTVYAVAESGVAIDELLWNSRAEKGLAELHPRPELKKGFFTQMMSVNNTLRSAFRNEMSRFVQTKAAEGNPALTAALSVFGVTRAQVEKSNHVFLSMGRSIRKAFNAQLTFIIQNDLASDTEEWANAYKMVLGEIERLGRGDEKRMMDIALALWVVCMSMTNSAGQYSDQAVVNLHVWPMLMKAMTFYGIINGVRQSASSDRGLVYKVTAWKEVCVKCGKEVELTNPAHVMGAHVHNNVCRGCR